MINDMRKKISAAARLAGKLCHRQYGIGADGLILIQPARNGDAAYRMRIINSDGSEAEMCGNGARCAVKFAVESGVASAGHSFETLAGPISGKYISSNRVRVALTVPGDFRPRVDVPLSSGHVRGSFINTGVPHFVTFVARAESVDVISLGREIRAHRLFAPKGTNVNFVQLTRLSNGRARLKVRTFERGVESETLACGTGATASAIVAALTKNIRPPVQVLTTGGAALVIDFIRTGPARVSHVTMLGPVEKVFETKWMI